MYFYDGDKIFEEPESSLHRNTTHTSGMHIVLTLEPVLMNKALGFFDSMKEESEIISYGRDAATSHLM